MDEHYAELCMPIKEENQRRMDAWRSVNSATITNHQRKCEYIDNENCHRLAAWEAADTARIAEHDRVCAQIDDANRHVIAEWEAKNAAIIAVHYRAYQEIEQTNRRILAAWEAENASRQAAYDRARSEMEQENQRLTAAWEAVKAARQAEHDRACRKVDAVNRQLIADWEDANAPWVAEEKRWRDRLSGAEAEIRRLEAEINAQQSESVARFQQRKDKARGVATRHDLVKRDHERELKRAEIDSKLIQLEEHLNTSLICQANLKGITDDRILSLESFGIETAKDVLMLNHQKVPGIGAVLSKRLFDWRKSLVSSFVPKQTLPESERARIASRYAPALLPLAQSVQGAIQDLEVILGSHRARERELLKAIETAVQNAAIAEAHVKAMGVR